MNRIACPIPLDRELMAELMDAVRHLMLQLECVLSDAVPELPRPALEVRHGGCRSIRVAGAITGIIRQDRRSQGQ
jgi:hypothetical protein